MLNGSFLKGGDGREEERKGWCGFWRFWREQMYSRGVLLEYTLIYGAGGRWWGGVKVEVEVGTMCSRGSFTSWHSELRGRHPPPPLAAADAIGRWGGGGWPACRTSVWARPPWTCFPPRSSQWHRSCQSCHNPALWSQLGFSGRESITTIRTLQRFNGWEGWERCFTF